MLPSALKHGGLTEADLLHALRNEHHHFTQDDGLVMVIGPAQDGELIEVGIVEWHGEIAVVHGMRPARHKYL